MVTPSENSSGNEKNDQPSQLGKNLTWTLTSGDQLGVALKPTDAAEYEVWKPIDSMVKSWLTSSISKEISEYLIHCDSAFALWKELEECFGTSCGRQLYHVQREMVTTEQGTDTIKKYWNRLHRWWDEWTRLSPSPRCHCGKCMWENMAIQLERQREVNLTYGGTNAGASVPAISEMVMAVKGARNEGYKRRETKEEKYSKYCEHCHLNGYLKEACFKLQGYPDWYKELKKRNGNNKKPSKMAANVVDSPLEDPPVEKTEQGNQMAVLSMLMKELSKVMKGGSSESVNFAQLGNFAGNMNNSIETCKCTWIIDTGA
ncbi:uncharacterized protein G2W53_017807 [Senna tora]|uniref:Retrotransposon gag domain-containing protein n=1 Tax=Senna tora TaxID=362788 RepID=A0A834TQS2_9FABA|nr:uncharacterized protein G2W53_017807 [Senna tora]